MNFETDESRAGFLADESRAGFLADESRAGFLSAIQLSEDEPIHPRPVPPILRCLVFFFFICAVFFVARGNFQPSQNYQLQDLYLLPGDDRVLKIQYQQDPILSLDIKNQNQKIYANESVDAYLFLDFQPKLDLLLSQTQTILDLFTKSNLIKNNKLQQSFKRIFRKALHPNSRVKFSWDFSNIINNTIKTTNTTSTNTTNTTSDINAFHFADDLLFSFSIFQGVENYSLKKSIPLLGLDEKIKEKGSYEFSSFVLDTYIIAFEVEVKNRVLPTDEGLDDLKFGKLDLEVKALHYSIPKKGEVPPGLSKSCSLTLAKTCKFHLPTLSNSFILLSVSNSNDLVFQEVDQANEANLFKLLNIVTVQFAVSNYIPPTTTDGDSYAGGLDVNDTDDAYPPQKEITPHDEDSVEKFKHLLVFFGSIVVFVFIFFACIFVGAFRRAFGNATTSLSSSGDTNMFQRFLDSTTNGDENSRITPFQLQELLERGNHGWLNQLFGIEGAGFGVTNINLPEWEANPLPPYEAAKTEDEDVVVGEDGGDGDDVTILQYTESDDHGLD